MMQLNTRHFGVIEIEENDILNFEDGIPGFEYIKKFMLIKPGDEESPFQWLQSVDHPQYTFVVVDPFKVVEDYTINVPDNDIISLSIESIADVTVYCIVVIPEDVSKMTANLKGPVIINTRLRKGKQVLLENSPYSIKHSLINQPE